MIDMVRTGPIRMEAMVEGWTLPRTGWADGPPDQRTTVTIWHEPDGRIIVDEDRIAALDAQIAQEARHGDT